MATHSFPVSTHLISICKWLSARKSLNKATNSQANIFIYLLDHVYEAPFANMKIEFQRWPEMPLILERSGTQYVAMVTKLLSSNCRAHLVESYCKDSNISDTNWLRYLFSWYLTKIWLSVWHHHLADLHILTWISLEQREIFEKIKKHFSSHTGYLFMF